MLLCVCVCVLAYVFVFAKVVTCGQKFATFTTARNYTLIVWTNTHAFKHNTYTHTRTDTHARKYSNKPKNHLQLYYIVIVFTLTFVHTFFENKLKRNVISSNTNRKLNYYSKYWRMLLKNKYVLANNFLFTTTILIL